MVFVSVKNGNLSRVRGLAEDVGDGNICFSCSSVQQCVRLPGLPKDDVHSVFLVAKDFHIQCNLGAPALSVSALKFCSLVHIQI